MVANNRAGLLAQQGGYSAFIPNSLNPPPDLVWDQELAELLAEAGLGVGRLDGLSRALPNPDLFISIFVRQEAVLSSQIEGTQCTLEDVLNFPVQPEKVKEKDILTVINYVEAMNYGLQRLNDSNGLPLSMRLLREIHTVLMSGARGQNRDPGELRRIQNWIGPAGSTLMTASFVPPPVPEMHEALLDLERFLHVRSGIPPLIQIAIAHAQFETIHPFLDGNGRLGRLLITLFLCERNLLKRPLLYLSHYLKSNQYEYYRRLTAIRQDGDWEGWLKFFLTGVRIVSDQAVTNAELLLALRESHRIQIHESVGTTQALKLLDYLCDQPIVTAQMVAKHLTCAYVTAQRLIEEFETLDLLKETTGQKRNKKYEYAPYLRFWKAAQEDYGTLILTATTQNSAGKKRGELVVGWITERKKLVFFNDSNGKFVGLKIMLNSELEALLRAVGEEKLDYYRHDLQPIPVEDDHPALQSLIDKNLTDREFELAGKEAIGEVFYTIRDVLGKRTSGLNFWRDDLNGSALVFQNGNVQMEAHVELADIKNYLVSDIVRDKVKQLLANEIRKLPVETSIKSPYKLERKVLAASVLKNVPEAVIEAIEKLASTWDRRNYVEQEIEISPSLDVGNQRSWIFRYRFDFQNGLYCYHFNFPTFHGDGGKFWYSASDEHQSWDLFQASFENAVKDFAVRWRQEEQKQMMVKVYGIEADFGANLAEDGSVIIPLKYGSPEPLRFMVWVNFEPALKNNGRDIVEQIEYTVTFNNRITKKGATQVSMRASDDSANVYLGLQEVFAERADIERADGKLDIEIFGKEHRLAIREYKIVYQG